MGPNLITDSLAEISRYIASTIAFVQSTAIGYNENIQKLACPFQFDIVFALKGVKKNPNKQENDDDDDVDDDDDEQNDDDKKKQDDDKQENDEFYDVFGDLKKKITSNGLKHIFQEISDEILKNEADYKRYAEVKGARFVKQPFIDEFSKKYDNKTQETYPSRYRFCAVVDRRKPDKNKNILAKDELLLFAPSKYEKFPNEEQDPLFYFNASRTCIIPEQAQDDNERDKDKNKDKDEDEEADQIEKDVFAAITTLSQCKGAALTLSFHVESEDEIRCYLFLNGQGIRFFPEDIKLLLPQFFDSEYLDNATFANSEEAESLIDEMNKTLSDLRFEAFLMNINGMQ